MAGVWSNQVETAEKILPCATLQVTYFLLLRAFLHPSSWKIKIMTPSRDDSLKYVHTPIHMHVYVPKKQLCVCVHPQIDVCACVDMHT